MKHHQLQTPVDLLQIEATGLKENTRYGCIHIYSLYSEPHPELTDEDLEAFLFKNLQTIIIEDSNSKFNKSNFRTFNTNLRRVERYTDTNPDTSVIWPIQHRCNSCGYLSSVSDIAVTREYRYHMEI